MKIDFLSSDFEQYLKGKLKCKQITDENIRDIEEISLNAFKYDKTKYDYDFRDFEKLPNLKYIHLNEFTIRNYETNEINRCSQLVGLQFTNCILKAKSRIQVISIETMVFEYCKGFSFYYISLLKNIKIFKLSYGYTERKKIDLKDMLMFKNLEKLFVEGGRLLNFKNLNEIKKLKYVQIFRCKWNKEDVKVLNSNVEVEEIDLFDDKKRIH